MSQRSMRAPSVLYLRVLMSFAMFAWRDLDKQRGEGGSRGNVAQPGGAGGHEQLLSA